MNPLNIGYEFGLLPGKITLVGDDEDRRRLAILFVWFIADYHILYEHLQHEAHEKIIADGNLAVGNVKTHVVVGQHLGNVHFPPFWRCLRRKLINARKQTSNGFLIENGRVHSIRFRLVEVPLKVTLLVYLSKMNRLTILIFAIALLFISGCKAAGCGCPMY